MKDFMFNMNLISIYFRMLHNSSIFGMDVPFAFEKFELRKGAGLLSGYPPGECHGYN